MNPGMWTVLVYPMHETLMFKSAKRVLEVEAFVSDFFAGADRHQTSDRCMKQLIIVDDFGFRVLINPMTFQGMSSVAVSAELERKIAIDTETDLVNRTGGDCEGVA